MRLSVAVLTVRVASGSAICQEPTSPVSIAGLVASNLDVFLSSVRRKSDVL